MQLGYGYHEMSFKTDHGEVKVNIVRGNHNEGWDMHMITADGSHKLKGICEFDTDKLDILSCVNGNYFQMSNGRHLGVEGDGVVLGYSQEPKQAKWLALYQRYAKLGIVQADDYWYSQNDIDFVCSPYCTRIFAGVQVAKYSTACDYKDDILNEQTAIFKFFNGDWAEAIFSKCYPRDVEAFVSQFGNIECLALMDSGGSTQMVECTSGIKRIVRNTGRKISDVMVLGRLKSSANKDDGYKEMYEKIIEEDKKYITENEVLKQKINKALYELGD